MINILASSYELKPNRQVLGPVYQALSSQWVPPPQYLEAISLIATHTPMSLIKPMPEFPMVTTQ